MTVMSCAVPTPDPGWPNSAACGGNGGSGAPVSWRPRGARPGTGASASIRTFRAAAGSQPDNAATRSSTTCSGSGWPCRSRPGRRCPPGHPGSCPDRSPRRCHRPSWSRAKGRSSRPRPDRCRTSTAPAIMTIERDCTSCGMARWRRRTAMCRCTRPSARSSRRTPHVGRQPTWQALGGAVPIEGQVAARCCVIGSQLSRWVSAEPGQPRLTPRSRRSGRPGRDGLSERS